MNIFDDPNLRPEAQAFKAYLEELDQYEQPHFVLIRTSAVDEIKAIILEGVAEIDKFDLYDDLCVFCGEYDAEDMEDFISQYVMTQLKEQKLQAHIAVFRHNCLGEAYETFSWAMQLLSKVQAQSPNESGFAINDFQGEDWPGLSEYTEEIAG